MGEGVAMLSGGLIMEEETPLITDKRVLAPSILWPKSGVVNNKFPCITACRIEKCVPSNCTRY